MLVKSLDPGEQIVHAKFRDKGINDQEGLWKEYVAEVQWFKVAIATFDKPATVGAWGPEYTDVPVSGTRRMKPFPPTKSAPTIRSTSGYTA